MILRQRVAVLLLGKRSFRLTSNHQLLRKVRHLRSLVLLIESDDVRHRLYRSLRTKRFEIRVQVGLELVQQNLELGVVVLAVRRNVGWIDDRRAQPLDVGNGRGHECIDRIVESEKLLSHYADARSLQTIDVEKFRVVGTRVTFARSSCSIAAVDSCECCEKYRRIRNGA